jgi:FMN phosphatase YigB (HAD superfamily)
MLNEQEYAQIISERFEHLRNKKVLIYGTGIIAKRFIHSLSGFRIRGIVDRLHFGGEFEGVPIVLWDEIGPEDADAVIIASARKNYKVIYQRILDKCILYNIDIYGESGLNLKEYFGWRFFNIDDSRYFRKNERELKQLISQYDAVSFDLFDTLIMRKTLEPADVFDIVEDRIQKKGIQIPRFKIMRREAELQAKGANLYKIYEILGKQAGLTKEQEKIVMETELACEKCVLLPRKKMIEIFEYARSLGKKVSIISDMYLTEELLGELLEEMHIRGYNKIYVSCDYGVSKGNGLFERYLKDNKNMSCLHIGDNPMADVQAPLKYGMDSYGIKSAFEMMKISNFVNIMPWVNHCNEKNLLGLVLAEVFNNPFALYDTAGVVRVDSFEKIGKIFAASLAAIYILELISYLEKETDYQKVIFGARDGYIFMKIYDKFREKYGKNRELPEPVYLLVSRKLCIRAGMKTGNDVGILKIYGNSDRPETTLTGILGIPEERTVPYDQESYADVLDYYNVHQEEILDRSRIVRQRYKKYLEHCGLDLNQKYLFCDFISQGTILHLLNQIFYKPIDGFFLSRYIVQKPFPIHAESIYVDLCHGGTILFEKHCFLETIFSSPEPSVEDMDENDKPIFSNEIRTEEEIKNMCIEQEGIEKFFWDYYENLWVDGKKIKKELPEALVYLCDELEYVGECCDVRKMKLYNDLDNDYRDTLQK